MSDDYGYINARLRAMKSRLLKGREYEAALSADEFADLVSFLDNTSYGEEVERALALKKGIRGVDEGLRRNLEKTLDAVARLSSDRPRDLIHIVLGRWELLNIKTILRGKHINASPDAIISNLVPFGRLDDVGLSELAKQAHVKGVIDLLAQWRIPYAAPLSRAFLVYREKEDLQLLETALDRAYFETSLRQLDEGEADDAIVADFLGREIDVILIGYAMRNVHHGLSETDISAVFIPGGKAVDRAKFERMVAARDIEEIAKIVDDPFYKECLDSAMFRYLETRRLSTLERALETGFIRKAGQGITRDPLSIAVPIAFLWLKMNEIVNLRLIARGKHTSMPRSEIEKHLVVMT